MDYIVNLVAGVKKRLGVGGRVVVLTDTGAAPTIGLRMLLVGTSDEEINSANRGWKARFVTGRFTDIELVSAVNTVAKIIVSDNDIEFNTTDGATVTANIAANPLPVSNDRGSPGNLLYVSGVSVADAPATSAVAAAPVAVTSAGQVVAAANAARRELRLLNIGPDPVAIGPAGATWAQRVIVLQVDDVFVETRGANLAWSAITDAGKTASVGVQSVLA